MRRLLPLRARRLPLPFSPPLRTTAPPPTSPNTPTPKANNNHPSLALRRHLHCTATHAAADSKQAVIIGGGVIGASCAFHLAKLGWRNVTLLERKTLASFSSGLAAGGCHRFNGNINMAQLQDYTISLYQELEQEHGQHCGLHVTGGVNVASSEERWEFLQALWASHQTMGLATRLVTPAEIQDMCPIIDISGVRGGLYDDREGHIDPHSVTHAYARAARQMGVEIRQHAKVEALRERVQDGLWEVVLEDGSVLLADHVVNAAGLWAREVGAMAGVQVPILPMAHQYLITEPIPALASLSAEMPTVLDLDGESYLRQERSGILIGVYEQACQPWSLGGTDWAVEADSVTMAPDMARIEDELARGMARYPVLAETGIASVVHAPFTFAPDGNPLVGPVPNFPRGNFWSACGVMAGFSQGGGVGKIVAEWMVHGKPSVDVLPMDVARFGPFATVGYAQQKSLENYQRRFRVTYPNEQLRAVRPLKRTPLYRRMREENAVFGASYGMEYPVYFAPPGQPAEEEVGLGRSNAFGPVGEEARATRAHAGLIELCGFSKYEVSGPEAYDFLDRLLACRLPHRNGRACLAPMLGPSGRLMGDLSLLRLANNRFWLVGSAYLQAWHMRWFEQQALRLGYAGRGAVAIHNITDAIGGFVLSGPRSRDILTALARPGQETAFASDVFRFMDVRDVDLGPIPATICRMSVTGELGYEIYVDNAYHETLYEQLAAAGAEHGLRNIGARALNVLRIEKAFGSWTHEFTSDYTPAMTGLNRFVAYDKVAPFIGKDAAQAERDGPPPTHRVAALEVHPDQEADAVGWEPLWHGEDHLVGWITSGEYGHTVGKSLALGFVRSDLLDSGVVDLQTHIVGRRTAVTVLREPPHDPQGLRMRS